MLARTTTRALASGFVIAASLLGAAGCGGLGPGDYLTFRIASESEKPAASCYPNGEIPINIQDDKTTFRNGQTVIVYVTKDDDALLDTGDLVLTGTIDGDSYSFKGSTTDVDYAAGTIIFDSDNDGIDDSMDPFVDADADGQDDQGVDQLVDTDADGLDDRFSDGLVDADHDGTDDRYREIPSDTRYTSIATVTVKMTVDGSVVTGTNKTKLSEQCEGSLCPANYAASCTRTTKFKGIEIDETDPGFGSGSASPTP